ncbi:MAG: hypothetical protein M9936_20900 [Caldilinea sp.]|nr:hypothetical protein [Caldilinea sp.]MCB9121788.1 50S rRNA methyltransferase [Caldilineaceae bacterium]MCB0053599.1 hypothetical protein [Caldilinea sp.]MCB9123117.1 50S rRNA methyltransferase [Caldilineaceae bacterium]MCO5212161.1 hypothetical protein [Caldilinea sp.]
MLDSLFLLTCDEGSTDLALEEVKSEAAPGAILDELAQGVYLVDAGEPFAALAARWQTAPPIFVRHIAPVQLVVPLGGHAGDVGHLTVILAASLPPLDPAEPFSVQTRILTDLPYKPYDVNTALSAALAGQSGAAIDVRDPHQIVSVACARLSRWRPDASLLVGPGGVAKGQRFVALAGLSLAERNLSDWAGGMRRFAREDGQISRAEFKLLEALEVFNIVLPPRGVALDLGASPGGWTRVLRQADQYVTAIDPGDLDPRLGSDAGVRHKRMTAEAYLAAGPDSFDLIVNDMRMDGRDSARLMVAFAPYLYRHGIAIMTVKLPEQGRRPILDHAFSILREAYDIAGARQLFHNRSEITLYLRRRR